MGVSSDILKSLISHDFNTDLISVSSKKKKKKRDSLGDYLLSELKLQLKLSLVQRWRLLQLWISTESVDYELMTQFKILFLCVCVQYSNYQEKPVDLN